KGRRILFAGTTEAGRPRSFDWAPARSILSVAFEPWSMRDETAAAFSLLSAEAVRSRAHRMLALGLDDRLPNFRVELSRLDATADLVIGVMREAYPGLAVPFHSRWRHFTIEGHNRYDAAERLTGSPDRFTRARAAFDLAIVSVLLDAGAGPQWRYRDAATGRLIGRSAG